MDHAPAVDRVTALDLIRGIAVLGILAVNIDGFAGPVAATYTPHAIHPPTAGGDAAFAGMLLLFEGKMRTLFSILFGASMALFIARADAAGRDGQALQLRRLLWLAVFGYLHYLLLWWGDILFLYAVGGVIALALRQMPPRGLLVAALLAFTLWQAQGTLSLVPRAGAQLAVEAGTASAQQRSAHAESENLRLRRLSDEMTGYRLGFAAQVTRKARKEPFYPLEVALYALGETVPLMAIGMVLFGSGFFSAGWSGRRLASLAAAGIGTGSAATACFVVWAFRHGFPVQPMIAAITYALGFPHLLMALGYAALLVLAAPRLAGTWLGERLVAAGRMAFSNYIATTLVMTALFYGWGLDLIGRVPVAAHPLFVMLGWALMLGWSKPWLARYRQGPLEWLWRSLTEWRRLPMRR